MGHSYHKQSAWGGIEPTMTVGELIDKLSTFDLSLPVAFQSPENGCFGPLQEYTLENAELQDLPEERIEHEAGEYEDDETGETIRYAAQTEVRPGWKGVVIT